MGTLRAVPLHGLLLLLCLGLLPDPSAAQGATNLVGVMPIEGAVQKPANLFDLEGKTLRFTPGADGSYTVQALSSADVVECPTELRDSSTWPIRSWAIPLPFRFPFAGRTWERVFVSIRGNITFEKSEPELDAQRTLWADGSMRAVAAAVDSRSIVGMERMIAVLWADCLPDPEFSRVRVRLEDGALAVTWSVRRAVSPGVIGQAKEENLFQARLYPSGAIEMAYPRVAERDGIVGLFTGQAVSGARLDHAEFTGQAPHPSVDIASADIYDAGTLLRFVYTMKNDALASVSSGTLMYRFFINRFGFDDSVAIFGTDMPRAGSGMSPQPATFGFQIQGHTVTFYLSKVLFGGVKQFTWSGDVVWWGMPERFAQIAAGKSGRTVDLSAVTPGEADLSAGVVARLGNLFEVFHYPQVTRNPEQVLASIYRQFPPTDDFAVIFTDFRFDDLFPGEGGSFSGQNVPIRGIGPSRENPPSTAWLGSTRLQISMETTWIGAYAFQETGTMIGQAFRNHAKGVSWISHEATHRWGPDLRFRNPSTGQEQLLADVHWLYGLHNPAYVPLGNKYIETTDVGHSIQGGAVWTENADGTFSPKTAPWGIPGGLSALDLYVMGLLPPEQVPDTFILQNSRDLGNNRWSATKVPVRIQDIIAAMGPRVPSATVSQKAFRLAFYLIHEPGRTADPALVQRANSLARAVADFFETASGGRMKIIHARAQPVPSTPGGLTANSPSSLQVNLAWTDNSGDETGFRIERKTDGQAFRAMATLGANVTSYADTSVSGGTPYTYRVLAGSAVGDSLPSNEASVTP
jgi:hypothetical protein